ncbi:hypothetical protein PANT111_190268 [Pantoea brenneri]|uniref:Uncharacterized protein n=1 Tax=Pantoea brenneri TaxID=472694 RepID=A0AAX3J869_9GAMM|nr:hypothetical protein PANT111_190268 [Pantoea brenneri]
MLHLVSYTKHTTATVNVKLPVSANTAVKTLTLSLLTPCDTYPKLLILKRLITPLNSIIFCYVCFKWF